MRQKTLAPASGAWPAMQTMVWDGSRIAEEARYRERDTEDERQPHETHGPSGPPMLSSDLHVLSIVKEGTREKDPFMAKTSHAGSDHCVDGSKTNQRGNS